MPLSARLACLLLLAVGCDNDPEAEPRVELDAATACVCPTAAVGIGFDPESTSLAAEDVQGALEELSEDARHQYGIRAIPTLVPIPDDIAVGQTWSPRVPCDIPAVYAAVIGGSCGEASGFELRGQYPGNGEFICVYRRDGETAGQTNVSITPMCAGVERLP